MNTSALEVNVNPIDFSTVTITSMLPEQLKLLSVTNAGTAPLSITGWSITGTGFRLASGAVPVVIQPGQVQLVGVAWKPLLGTFTGSVTITSNAPNSPHSVGLLAKAVPLVAPTVTGVTEPTGNPVTARKEGEEILLSGRGFGQTPGKVVFDGIGWGEVVEWSDSQVRVRLPRKWLLTGKGSARIIERDGLEATFPFIVQEAPRGTPERGYFEPFYLRPNWWLVDHVPVVGGTVNFNPAEKTIGTIGSRGGPAAGPRRRGAGAVRTPLGGSGKRGPAGASRKRS